MFGTTDEVLALLDNGSNTRDPLDDSRADYQVWAYGCTLDLECQCDACQESDRVTESCIRSVWYSQAPSSPWLDRPPVNRIAPLSARLLLGFLTLAR